MKNRFFSLALSRGLVGFVIISLLLPNTAVFAQSAEPLLQEATVAEATGAYEEVERLSREAIRLEPENTWAHYKLGVALLEQEKYAPAEESFRRAISLDVENTNAWAHFKLGQVLGFREDYDSAERSFEAAINVDPSLAWAHYELGHLLLKLQNFNEAEAALRQAVLLYGENDNCTWAWKELGIALMGQRRYVDAEEAERKSIACATKDEDKSWAYYNLGLALEEQTRYAEAAEAQRNAIALLPDQVWAHYHLGEVLLRQGLYAEAKDSFESVIDLDSSNVHAYNRLGFVAEKQGDIEQAKILYRRAIEIDRSATVAPNSLQEIERAETLRANPNRAVEPKESFVPREGEPDNLLRSTVYIVAATSGGSNFGVGWVVKREGDRIWIVTNRHVLTETGKPKGDLLSDIQIEYYVNAPSPADSSCNCRVDARIEKTSDPLDEKMDVALLVVDNAPSDIVPLKFATSAPSLGTELNIPGMHGGEWSLEKGNRSTQNMTTEMRISGASIGAGSSGSPVLDSSSNVTGMIFDVKPPGYGEGNDFLQGYSYALTFDALKEILQTWGVL
jgi:tetratricopeptide (TPR) repeat protein